jgi:predicted  nucleic acid-binding Zn-ribbon protein
MSTKTKNEQLDELRQRIDMLEERARAASAGVKQSIQGQVDALRRQEAAARTALREQRRPNAQKTSGHGDPTKDKYLEIEKKLGAAEYELAAEIARGPHHDHGSAGH